MLRISTFLTSSLIVAGSLSAQCDSMKTSLTSWNEDGMDIVDTAVSAGQFGTLVTAVKAAGLVETLKGKGPFTVFAPTDAAFDALPEGTIPALLKDKAQLQAVLTYHVAAGEMMAKSVVGSKWIDTIQGQALMVSQKGKSYMIDGAKIIKTDIKCSNGVIHVIDAVVLPRKDIVDTAVEAGSFKTLATAVTKAKLVEALKGEGPFTVFAPADSAFAKLPEGTVEGLIQDIPALQNILKYHVIKGRVLSSDLPMNKSVMPETLNGQKLDVRAGKSGVMVNGAKVVSADIICGNGIIHVIDSVVLPKAVNAGATR